MTGPQRPGESDGITKYRPDRSSGRTTQTNIAEKLQDIAAEIEERGHANLTRLTVLKKWFEAPGRIISFGSFVAVRGSGKERADMRTRTLVHSHHSALHRLFLGGLLPSRARVRLAGSLMLRQALMQLSPFRSRRARTAAANRMR